MLGKKSINVVMAICNSKRAKCAPRQKCIPAPRERFARRLISGLKSSGSVKYAGSRFAAARSNPIFSPALK